MCVMRLSPNAAIAMSLGGSGFVIFKALVLLVGIPMKEAVGAFLRMIAFKSATRWLGYLSQVEINWV